MAWLSNSGFIGAVILTVAGWNILLGAIVKIAYSIKDRTATTVDDQVYDKGSKVLVVTTKVYDWLVGNLQHGKDIPTNGK